jgi:hypothetical protein
MEVTGALFVYSIYPDLASIVDSNIVSLEIWDRKRGQWVDLDPVNGFPRAEMTGAWVLGHFLIMRRAGHPSNIHCIGLPDLVRETDFQEHDEAKVTFSPGTTTPDVAGLLRQSSWIS